MDGRPLTRLRIAFLLLGAALLLPLGLLLRSVDARLEAQRRLRHELVAERIFDEMEGELSALLARESARPSEAYVGVGTRVENWAPFVVGYFTRDAHGVQIVAKPQLAADRLQRLTAALKSVDPKLQEPEAAHGSGVAPALAPYGTPEPLQNAQERRDFAAPALDAARTPPAPAPSQHAPEPKAIGTMSAPEPAAAREVQRVPEAIIKQLNRAGDVRVRGQLPLEKRKGRSAASDIDDPLSGME